MQIKEMSKQFWKFLKEDSIPSLIVTLLIAFVLIKYIIFPLLTLLTGTPLPLVIVESCSMYHYEDGFEQTLSSPIYEENNITMDDTKTWDFQNGLNKGDVIFVTKPKNLEVGDVIIFDGGSNYPIIHRLIADDIAYATKGDNYKTNHKQLATEKNILENQIIGKAVFKIPSLGWVKLIFYEHLRSESEKGLCK